MFYIIYELQVESFYACQQNYQFRIKLSKELYGILLETILEVCHIMGTFNVNTDRDKMTKNLEA